MMSYCARYSELFQMLTLKEYFCCHIYIDELSSPPMIVYRPFRQIQLPSMTCCKNRDKRQPLIELKLVQKRCDATVKSPLKPYPNTGITPLYGETSFHRPLSLREIIKSKCASLFHITDIEILRRTGGANAARYHDFCSRVILISNSARS